MTLQDCVATMLAAADAAGFHDVALVGHSLGGVTITETAFLHPDRVRWAIYLAGAHPHAPERAAAQLMLGTDAPSGVMRKIPEEISKPLFGNDLDDERWASVAARLVDDAQAIIDARVSGMPLAVHRVYIGLTDDVPVPPALVDMMIGDLGPDVDRRTIEAGHMVMNSRPDALTAACAEVVRVRVR